MNRMHGYWFTSPLFRIEPGEDEETNPGVGGRQLAEWLAPRLEARGYHVEPAIAEDWGWCLVLAREPFLLWIGCGNVDDDAVHDALDGATLWHCFAEAEVPLLRRWFGKSDTGAALAKLDAALRAILQAEPAIRLVPAP